MNQKHTSKSRETIPLNLQRIIPLVLNPQADYKDDVLGVNRVDMKFRNKKLLSYFAKCSYYFANFLEKYREISRKNRNKFRETV
jgi:hypothetical protein